MQSKGHTGGIATSQLPLGGRLAQLEEFIENLNIYIYFGDDSDSDDLYPACYIGATDTIGMPYPVEFFAPEDHRAILDYYRVLFHEIGHWTGHPQRLDRKHGSTYGSKAYALEELTAELTSAFVMNRLQITEPTVLKKDEYLTKWRSVIAMFGNDVFSITTAELQAYKACDYLFKLQERSPSLKR